MSTIINRMRNRAAEERGFTLIELLVVILIIGILAAIALPTFLGQSDKAKDASAKSDVRNAVTQIESYLADGPTLSANWLNDTNVPALSQFKLIVRSGANAPTSNANGTYSITAESKAGSGHWYKITKDSPGGYTYTKGPDATGSWTSGE